MLFKVIIMSLLLITFGLTFIIDIGTPVGKSLALCIFGMCFHGGCVLASSGIKEKETYWRILLIHASMHSKALLVVLETDCAAK